MIRRPPRSTRTDTLFPYTTLFRSDMARAVLEETGLLPHRNPGLMGAEDYAALRPYAASLGIMLERVSERLCEHGGTHSGSPDKRTDRESVGEGKRESVSVELGGRRSITI